MSGSFLFMCILGAIALASGLAVWLLRRRYQEPEVQEYVDMEEVIYELEGAAGCLEDLSDKLKHAKSPDEPVTLGASDALGRARCLLEDLADTVEYAIAEIEISAKRRASRRSRRGSWCVDFLNEEEYNKFSVMPSISEDEVRRLDWDDFLKKL